MGTTVEARFWVKVDKTSDCWVWTGAVNSRGYGSFGLQGSMRQAHRVAYELLVGPIPAGLVLDHLCRNRLCVRPEHLEVVTNRENVLRGVGACATNARKTRCVKGHPLVGENLSIEKGGGRRCVTCRREKARRWYNRNVQRTDA